MRPLSADATARVRKHKDRAVELMARGKLEAALAEYLEALSLAPSDVFSRQRAAEILARLGKTPQAIKHYGSLVGKYATEGHLLRAIATCHLILQLEPAHAETLSTLSDLFAKRDTPKVPMRMPEAMCGAMGTRPSTAPPMIDPSALARIPLFSELAPDAFVSLAREFRRREVRAGEVVVEEGAPGNAMFAIAHGHLRVERRMPDAAARIIAVMTDGEFFGEMSLVSRCPRFATVTATSDAEVLEIGRNELQAIVAMHPHVGDVLERFYKERLLANVLRASPILRKLPAEAHAALGEVLRIEAHPAKRLLLEQAQPSTGFFMLLRGECEVFHTDAEGSERPYPSMREGDVFGEISLLQGSPVTASVRTAVPSVLLRFQRESFDALLLAHSGVRQAIYDLASQRLDRTRTIVAEELFDRGLV